MKSQVLHTVWCYISGEAAGEMWKLITLGSRRFNIHGTFGWCWTILGLIPAKYSHSARSHIRPPRWTHPTLRGCFPWTCTRTDWNPQPLSAREGRRGPGTRSSLVIRCTQGSLLDPASWKYSWPAERNQITKCRSHEISPRASVSVTNQTR